MSTAEDLEKWAGDLDSFGPEARLSSDDDSRRTTRAELESALGGSAGVARVLRGRPALKGKTHMPGEHAPKVTVRLTPHLDAALIELSARQHRNRSDVVRDALAEYAQRHSA